MRETKYKNKEGIMIDVKMLQSKLNCGYATATEVGKRAKARIIIGRRVWYKVSLIDKYLDDIAI